MKPCEPPSPSSMSEPVQVIGEFGVGVLERLDLELSPRKSKNERRSDRSQKRSQRPFDLERGPLFPDETAAVWARKSMSCC